MHETKKTNSNQTKNVQERKRQHQRKQHTLCIVFLEKVFCGLRSRTTFADVNKIKSSKCSVCIIENVCSHSVLTRLTVEDLTFDTVSF